MNTRISYHARVILLKEGGRNTNLEFSPFRGHILLQNEVSRTNNSKIPNGYSVFVYFDQNDSWKLGEARDVEIVFVHFYEHELDLRGMDFQLCEGKRIGNGQFLEDQNRSLLYNKPELPELI